MGSLPVTLWRYISADLWRLLLLTTAVLVCVISFAITIKPLADGELSPLDAIAFMLFACVPMLAYALPFAAGFAATLVFHRLSQDNELLASHAGGVSHKKVLAPALVTGIVLALVVGVLSDQVIPRFLRNMERLITEDVARLMVSRLGQGEPVEFGGNMIYADHAQSLDPKNVPGAENAEHVIALHRVAFGQIDDENRLEAAGTAERAFIVVHREGDIARGAGSTITLVAENARGWGETGTIEGERHSDSFTVPGAFRDDPKFWSFGELRELSDNPKKIARVGHWHKRIAFRAAALGAMRDMDGRLRASGSARLMTEDGDVLIVQAGGLGGAEAMARPIFGPSTDAPVIIEHQQADGRVFRYSAAQARIEAEDIDEIVAENVSFRIVLEEVSTSAQGDGEAAPVAGRRSSLRLGGVVPPEGEELLSAYDAMTLEELLAETRFRDEGVPPALADAQENAHSRERDLQREIVSKTHQRLAMSAACLVMVLVGATIAIKLREALPLTVYLWAFFPALGAVLVISMGEQIAQQSGFFGLVIMWGAVLGLLWYAYATYRQVALR